MARRLKIVLVGDAGVGKSEFVRCNMGFPFDPTYNPNNQIDVYNMEYENIDIAIWDFAGTHLYTNQKKVTQGKYKPPFGEANLHKLNF